MITTQTLNNSLGAWLYMQRRKRKVSACKLARLLGVHRNTVARWEKGGGDMPAWAYVLVAEEFKVQFPMEKAAA